MQVQSLRPAYKKNSYTTKNPSMRTFTVKILAVLLLSGLMYGCIYQDDLVPCEEENGAILFFEYFGDGQQDIFQDKIEEVTLYIYDNYDDSLVETIILSSEQLRQQKVVLDLPPGSYHAVAWGNYLDQTQTESTASASTAILGVAGYFRDEMVTTNDRLYFGKTDFTIPANGTVTSTVDFSSAHIKMVLDLADLRSSAITEGVSPIKFRMSELSPTVDFNGVFSDNKIPYYPSTALEGDDFVARFNTLRFEDINNIQIDLFYVNSTEPMYTLNLADYMAAHSITVDGINEITIGIRFVFTGTTVVVERWVESEITPGL